MQAAVYAGARTLRIEQRPPGAPGPGEVQLEVAYTGICGTDLHIFHGEMDARVFHQAGGADRAGGTGGAAGAAGAAGADADGGSAILGHEMSGRIAALGAGVQGWSIGAPVTVMPLRWCGQCPACRAGNEHICQRLTFLGIDASGSMQTRWTVPAHTLVQLPRNLPLRDAALVEPLAVAVHDVRRSGLAPGERALVVGGGPVGVLIAAVARDASGEVVVVEPNPHRRQVARSLGLAAVDPGAADVEGMVQDWTSGAGAEVAFEVSGSPAGVGTAVAALSARGRLVLVAIHSRPAAVDLHRFFWRELSLVGARLYRREDFETAVDLLASGRIPVSALVSRVEPLARVSEAFAALEAGEGVMKVLVDCRDLPEPSGADPAGEEAAR